MRREFTILGNVVNVASRIEGVAKQRGLEIVATAATQRLAGSTFPWRPLPPAQLRGKAEAVEVFALGDGGRLDEAN